MGYYFVDAKFLLVLIMICKAYKANKFAQLTRGIDLSISFKLEVIGMPLLLNIWYFVVVLQINSAIVML